jgi:hypothetical protein
MTTVGILNIVFGGFGALMGLLAILGGGILAAAGGSISSQSGADAHQAGTAAAAGGGMLMLIGFVVMICWAMLMVSGIGVLKMAPWGRTLSLACGGAGLALQLISFATGGFHFNLMSLVTIAYCGALVYLCMTPPWKAAFSKSSSSDATMTPSADRYRHAA